MRSYGIRKCDVTKESDIKNAVESTVRHFGGLDIIVSNAGIFPPSMNIESMDPAVWEKSMQLNLTSHQRLMKAAIPYLSHGIDPTIIIIASKNVPAPGPGAGAYSVAKAGLTQLGRVAALELGDKGIRVNMVHPNQVFDTAIWTKEVLEKRARHYGQTVEQYKTSNILHTKLLQKTWRIWFAPWPGLLLPKLPALKSLSTAVMKGLFRTKECSKYSDMKHFLYLLSFFYPLLNCSLFQDKPFLQLLTNVHNDGLYAHLSYEIINGHWLGNYNELTLLKNPFYPIWIAFVHFLHTPLLLANHLLYIFACVLFIIAIRPLVPNRFGLIVIYTFLLFNPYSYTQFFTLRFLRENIYPALTMIVISSSIALLIRGYKNKFFIAWGVLLGVSWLPFG